MNRINQPEGMKKFSLQSFFCILLLGSFVHEIQFINQ